MTTYGAEIVWSRLEESAEALRYVQSLASSIWWTHFRESAPDWRPLDTVVGVISQIDDMVSGMVRKEKAIP